MRSPSDPPYTAAARPAGPAPTTTRSKQRSGSRPTVRPRCSATDPGVALRSTVSEVMTAGRSLLAMPSCSASRSIDGRRQGRATRAGRDYGSGYFADSARLCSVPRPQYPDRGCCAAQQDIASGHERGQDQVAEPCVRGDDRDENLQARDAGPRPARSHVLSTKTALAGEQVQLAEEAACTMLERGHVLRLRRRARCRPHPRASPKKSYDSSPAR